MQIAVNPTNNSNISGAAIKINGSIKESIAVFSTTDGGATWPTQRVFPDDVDDGFTLARQRIDPTLGFDINGDLYVVYGVDNTPQVGFPLVLEQIAFKSTDGGLTFPESRIFDTPRNEKGILVAGRSPDDANQQDLYVAYSDFEEIAPNTPYPKLEIAHFEDVGAGLGGPGLAPTHVVDDVNTASLPLFGAPAIAPNGDLHVVWFTQGRDVPRGDVQIHHRYSTDGGQTFAPDISGLPDATIVDAATGVSEGDPPSYAVLIPPSSVHGIRNVPSIGIEQSSGGNHRVYVAYVVGEKDESGEVIDTDIVVQYYDNNDVDVNGKPNWSGRHYVTPQSDGHYQFHPWLSVDPISGMVAVGWLDTQLSPGHTSDGVQVQFHAAASIDRGATFDDQWISDAPTVGHSSASFLEYIGLAAFDSTIYALWPQMNDTTSLMEAIFAKSSVSIAGDFDEDGDVDGDDFLAWQSGFGTSSGATHGDGDADMDGDVDGDDFLIWQSQFGSGAGAGTQFDENEAVQVTEVIVYGSTSEHDAFHFSTVAGSGEQLRTVPVGGANRIAIVFSEHANVSASDLQLVGLTTGNVPTLQGFNYDLDTMTATWQFKDWAFGDQYAIVLSDGVYDAEGAALDGEWTNPAHVTTINSAVSEFPSGDGNAGGSFQFVMTLLPGDANQDNIVDGADYLIWQSYYGSQVGAEFDNADFNGDGAVNGTDFNIWGANQGTTLQYVWILPDVDCDNDVDQDDLDEIEDNFGMQNPTQADGDLDGDGDVDADDLAIALRMLGLDLDTAG